MSALPYAIRVTNLGKQYRIGVDRRYRALRDTLTDALYAPVRGLGRLVRKDTPARSKAEQETIWALRDVSFDVRPGEVVGVIGRNGAGKSSLLKILSRITAPTEGGVDLFGRVGSLLEIGTGFHPELTGRENVYLNGAILGMKRAEITRKFDEIVAFADLARFLDTPVKYYSSGMYMRLAFAVAAHLETEILLVDEVLAVGDADFQKKCLGKMNEVAQQGRAILFVSHNMQAIQRLCQRVILLSHGNLVADGRPEQVTKQYLGSDVVVTCTRSWQLGDPGNTNPGIYLQRAMVVNEDNLPSVIFDITKTLMVEVQYYNALSSVRPTAILHFINEAGLCLFSTGELNSPDWNASPLQPGIVRARCHIPGNFLAEGTFYILVALCSYNPNECYCIERDALVVQIVDKSSGEGVRGECVLEWPGVVRPKLKWSINYDRKHN